MLALVVGPKKLGDSVDCVRFSSWGLDFVLFERQSSQGEDASTMRDLGARRLTWPRSTRLWLSAASHLEEVSALR